VWQSCCFRLLLLLQGCQHRLSVHLLRNHSSGSAILQDPFYYRASRRKNNERLKERAHVQRHHARIILLSQVATVQPGQTPFLSSLTRAQKWDKKKNQEGDI
jgi:hypothetical protein